jgi:hypothetical protein
MVENGTGTSRTIFGEKGNREQKWMPKGYFEET